MKRLILFLVFVMMASFSCSTSKMTKEEREATKAIKAEQKEYEQLLKDAKKQHWNNQNKETRKMIRKSKRYSRKLDKRR